MRLIKFLALFLAVSCGTAFGQSGLNPFAAKSGSGSFLEFVVPIGGGINIAPPHTFTAGDSVQLTFGDDGASSFMKMYFSQQGILHNYYGYQMEGANGVFGSFGAMGSTSIGLGGNMSPTTLAGATIVIDSVNLSLLVNGSLITTNSVIQTNMCGFLTADATSTSTTFGNLTLSATSRLLTSHRYRFTLTLLLADSTAADGCKVDFNGGTATATSFRVHGQLVNDTGGVTALAAATSTTLAGVVNASAMTTANQHEFHADGTFEPSASGTFVVRFAQNAHSTGTLTVFRGSNLVITDMP